MTLNALLCGNGIVQSGLEHTEIYFELNQRFDGMQETIALNLEMSLWKKTDENCA
jgi:hypothetical protein